ncbi:DUF1885 family protein [Paenibacillus antri]|uniref:DUF1885 family protein n=1 Tax=Paenibacillus antri TaxID=2582848 RepID=A0A5R9G5Q2_9BACL|nr:DUF1885 family protein [Paenibacillus antri]TLS48284.1 DUF1885 family protein [Paenibacillus antri]
MSQSAYLYFTEGSSVPSVTLEELEQYLGRYKEQTSKTGQQLDWSYDEAAFPYTIEKKPEGEGVWFYLKAKDEPYKYIVFGVGTEKTDDGGERHYIQVVLPDGSTHADKSKGNELCKYLARTLKTELHLFNGRIMYFNPRK